MFRNSSVGTTALAPKSVLVTGVVLLVLGAVVSGPSHASAPSFLEIDGNIRSDGSLDWGHSGGSSGSGGAFAGGAFVNATTPPTAPAPTTALRGDASVLSTSFTVDPLASDSTPCGTGDSTAFTGQGGEKNGDRIDSMTFGTASVPPKDDLSNVYAVAHDLGLGSAEIFFAAERVVNTGESHIDFELLHAVASRTPGCSGSLIGNRSQGDLLLSVDFERGGALAGTHVYEWHCAEDGEPQPAHGTVCNPPANGPSVPHYHDVSAVPAVVANVTFRVNETTAVPCGGWACRASDGSQVASVPMNALFEGVINLTGAGFAGCISSLLPHTRSSDSFGATLKDFAGPILLETCPPPPPPGITTTTTTQPVVTTTTQPEVTTTTTTTTQPEVVTTTTTQPEVTTTTTTQPVVTTTPTTQPVVTTTPVLTEVAGTTITRVVGGAQLERPADLAPFDGVLPRTGSAVKPLLVWGGLAMIVGGALVMASRRRQEAGTER